MGNRTQILSKSNNQKFEFRKIFQYLSTLCSTYYFIFHLKGGGNAHLTKNSVILPQDIEI